MAVYLWSLLACVEGVICRWWKGGSTNPTWCRHCEDLDGCNTIFGATNGDTEHAYSLSNKTSHFYRPLRAPTSIIASWLVSSCGWNKNLDWCVNLVYITTYFEIVDCTVTIVEHLDATREAPVHGPMFGLSHAARLYCSSSHYIISHYII